MGYVVAMRELDSIDEVVNKVIIPQPSSWWNVLLSPIPQLSSKLINPPVMNIE